jgi:hypothetical protein
MDGIFRGADSKAGGAKRCSRAKSGAVAPGGDTLPKMQTSPPLRTDAQVLSVARALWSALFVSLFMYLLIGFQMGGTGPVVGGASRLALTLKVCATASFFFAFLLPRWFAKWLLRRRPAGHAPTLAEKFPPYLLRLVLFDVVALLGLALASRTFRGSDLWPFLLLAALGFLKSLPSKARLEAL